MGNPTTLGGRMKQYEAVTRTKLQRRTYTILRIDGRSFSTYTQGLDRPYDARFMADMDAVAEALCREISGAVLAFTQSDEVSLLVTDFASTTTQPWFDGNVQKIVSVAASLAAAVFNVRRFDAVGKLAMFDARAFTLPDPVEVANYFLWRQRDCVSNSIAMAAQSVFTHSELLGVSADRMQEKLWSEKGINWNDYPVGAKRGRVVIRVAGEDSVEYRDKASGETQTTVVSRSPWVTQPAPHFTANADGFLASIIPTQARFTN